ncbi:MAG: preprotein translocase subunit SecE [Clostridia bacterium]|nr:preprotein translocase subunit SecE [Clostridia bacterium]
MLVIALSNPWFFVDTRPLVNPTILTYTSFVLITALVLIVGFVLSVAHLLIDDYLLCAGKDKLTIPKRIVRFVRDYKSEVKKIVWPGLNEVVKNTIIVLIICAIIGAFVWLLDFGLGQLVQLIIG